jgi:hypothetical protein
MQRGKPSSAGEIALRRYRINPSKLKTSVHDSGVFSPMRRICEIVVGPLGNLAAELKYAYDRRDIPL